MMQWLYKNSAGTPSGPGLVLFLKCLIYFLTTAGVKNTGDITESILEGNLAGSMTSLYTVKTLLEQSLNKVALAWA